MRLQGTKSPSLRGTVGSRCKARTNHVTPPQLSLCMAVAGLCEGALFYGPFYGVLGMFQMTLATMAAPTSISTSTSTNDHDDKDAFLKRIVGSAPFMCPSAWALAVRPCGGGRADFSIRGSSFFRLEKICLEFAVVWPRLSCWRLHEGQDVWPPKSSIGYDHVTEIRPRATRVG